MAERSPAMKLLQAHYDKLCASAGGSLARDKAMGDLFLISLDNLVNSDATMNEMQAYDLANRVPDWASQSRDHRLSSLDFVVIANFINGCKA